MQCQTLQIWTSTKWHAGKLVSTCARLAATLSLFTHTHTHPQVSKSCLLRRHFIAWGVLLVGIHSPILRVFSGAGAGFTKAAFATATPVGAGASAPVAGSV